MRHVVVGRPRAPGIASFHGERGSPGVIAGWEGAPAPFLLRQRHTARVVEARMPPGGPVVADGVLDRSGGVVLRVLTADCVPLFLVDRASPAAALVHGGWRGLAAGIVEAALERLFAWGVKGADLVAWIGPSIGPCCYPVGREVADAFSPAAVIGGERGEPLRLDLYAAVREILLEGGVLAGSVEKRPPCTKCRSDFLYSHRGGGSGRNVALLWRTG